jgi:transmembrane sensor
MTGNASSRDELAELAAECFLCLRDPEADPQRKRRWHAWLAESPANREAFERCRAIWSAPLPADLRWPSEAEMAADSYEGDAPIPLPASGRRKAADGTHWRPVWGTRPWSPAARISAITAVGLAAVLGVIAVARLTEWTRPPVLYATGRGEQRRVILPDGSGVVLGPETRLEERFRPDERDITVQGGAALFTVVHDEARPFRVYAGSGTIQDLGTVFNVRSGPDGVTVTVAEGSVSVAPSRAGRQGSAPAAVTLTKGRQVTYRETLGPVQTVDPAIATAWRDGQLVFVDQTLRDVVADLQRYSAKDIALSGQAVDELRFTGTISVDKIDQWAIGLARVYPVQIENGDRRLVIAARPRDQ